jgi:NAD(P)-dependent dehydrogenase (short-subunit alcohol dehydrogenase family)
MGQERVRVALVTGAGQGVGAGIASTLASAGFRVLVNDLYGDRASAVASAVGGDALPFDVTDYDAVSAAFASAGPVDVLVNNAGIPVDGFPQTPFASSDPAVWRRFVDLNLYGVMNCTHLALPGMLSRGWGRVVTVSSEAGRHGLDIGVALYGAAKAGALGLMRHVAVEVAPFGVTVNNLLPGFTRTERMVELSQVTAVKEGVTPEQALAKFTAAVPMGRMGEPREFAALAAFLASERASYITGQSMAVDGGWIRSLL